MNSWSAAIKNATSPTKALQIYTQMQRNSTPIDTYSILYTLKSCTNLQNPLLIRHLHSHLLKLGFNSNVYVATSLLNAYMPASFTDASHLFREMPDRNTVTMNTMITGYSRSGRCDKARKLFDTMRFRNLGSWNAMISGYFNAGFGDKGLALFRKMLVEEKLMPNKGTLCSVLTGCGDMGSVGLVIGKFLHGFALKNGMEIIVELGTSFVDMYAKCGCFNKACLVFHLLQDKNLLSWTALICGAAQHGHGKDASALFERMVATGVRPNELTFTGILNACAQAGLVEEGRGYFKMISDFGLKPRIQHYGCLVDLFGKAGELEVACETIQTMPFEPNVMIWSSFLSSCKVHKKFEMVERVIDWILETVRPDDAGGVYNLLCDVYVLSNKLDDAERVRKLMATRNVKKQRGSSFVTTGTL